MEPFTGDDPEMRLDDWLPALEHATTWHWRTKEERLIQLAEYLRRRAHHEWTLSLNLAGGSELKAQEGSQTL